MIGLITRREYLSRVKKKSFIIMTLLGPFLIAAFYGAIIWMAIGGANEETLHLIAVNDESGLFQEDLKNTGRFQFVKTNNEVPVEDVFGQLNIPKTATLDQPKGIVFVSENSLTLTERSALVNQLEAVIEKQKLLRAGLTESTLDSVKADIQITEKISSEEGIKESNSAVNAGVGFVAAFLIYIFIFMYGVQVMKGVVEEKTNRIVEVMISSVKPFQLMMGKILGIALVGLTQLLAWLILSGVMISVISAFVGLDQAPQTMEQAGMNAPVAMQQGGEAGQVLNAFLQLPFLKLIGAFTFYFIFGYLLYSALFAVIGSAVDAETDTQQFMFPVTLPLIFGFVAAQSAVINNPHGELAYWLSMIPLTSPIVMVVRMPFDVPWSELLLSMILMIFGFIATTWLAARIYRIGILMYGKKASWKELWKWLWYKG
ncbi:MAG: ABC transporter permease [Bacteroidetes bacterium]|nr:MAG: ABC transporter permease [Bacteroidota bacterium]